MPRCPAAISAPLQRFDEQNPICYNIWQGEWRTEGLKTKLELTSVTALGTNRPYGGDEKGAKWPLIRKRSNPAAHLQCILVIPVELSIGKYRNYLLVDTSSNSIAKSTCPGEIGQGDGMDSNPRKQPLSHRPRRWRHGSILADV